MIVRLIEFCSGREDGEISYEQSYIVQLKSGIQISILDFDKNDLRNYIKKDVECLLELWINSDPPGFLVEGEYIGNLCFKPNWLKSNRYLSLNAYFGIKTIEGVFIIEEEEVKNFNLNKGDNVKFYADRINLVAWYSIN
ncbi:MAG: hypothetical protein KGD63_04500 [Candidatus Lokiarchaeota archaeon]|nr:hypothetical protein [Candidatus Lokiarchaeota archaeon]